jgi:hypothetical protein
LLKGIHYLARAFEQRRDILTDASPAAPPSHETAAPRYARMSALKQDLAPPETLSRGIARRESRHATATRVHLTNHSSLARH